MIYESPYFLLSVLINKSSMSGISKECERLFNEIRIKDTEVRTQAIDNLVNTYSRVNEFHQREIEDKLTDYLSSLELYEKGGYLNVLERIIESLEEDKKQSLATRFLNVLPKGIKLSNEQERFASTYGKLIRIGGNS